MGEREKVHWPCSVSMFYCLFFVFRSHLCFEVCKTGTCKTSTIKAGVDDSSESEDH